MKTNIFEQIEHPDTVFDKDYLSHCTNGALRTLLDKVKEMADIIRYEMHHRGMLSKEEYDLLKERDSL